MSEWLSRCHNVTLSQGVHSCDNEFIKENSDIREFSEFRDIMERGAGGEYALREGASLLKYALRGSVGVVGSATSFLNATLPSAGYPPKCAGWAHKHTKTRTKGLCADVRDVRDV